MIPTKSPKKVLRKRILRKPRKIDPYKRREAKRRRIRSGSLSRLQKRLDSVFSQFIRYSRADKEGKCPCYTCGHIYPVKKLHNGHYLLRGYKATRWDESNCRPQCGVCNLWRKGEPVVFRENLVKELGEKNVVALEQRRHQIRKWTADEMAAKIKEYELRVSSLTPLE